MTKAVARRLLGVWALSAVFLTLYPFQPRPAPLAFSGPGPFTAGLLFDLIANALFYLPAGVLAIAAGARARTALLAALTFSLAVELAQTHLALRTPSYHDLATNLAGAALGVRYAAPLLTLGTRLYTGRGRYAFLAAGVAATLLFARVFPALENFAFVAPFALAVLVALAASGLWRTPIAAAIALGAVVVAWPTEPLLWLCAAGGSALGSVGSSAGRAGTS